MYQQPNTYNTYYAQQSMRPIIPTPLGLKGRPVSSLEEARATSIDFDGSIFYFPDLANRRIYTKQINMDGTSTLNMYELKEIANNSSNNYVTREEFEQALSKIQAAITQEPVDKNPTNVPQAQAQNAAAQSGYNF